MINRREDLQADGNGWFGEEQRRIREERGLLSGLRFARRETSDAVALARLFWHARKNALLRRREASPAEG